MAFEHELEALAAKADAGAKAKRRYLRWLVWRRETVLDYRRLFVGEDRRVTAAGVRVLADIAHIAGIGVADRAGASEAELRERAGRRQLALHIFARLDLDGAALRDIAVKLRRLSGE